jgi:putative transposase
MKKSRHSEEKVIAAVKQMEGGRKTADVARELGVSAATLYAWKASTGACRSARPSDCGNWRTRTGA